MDWTAFRELGSRTGFTALLDRVGLAEPIYELTQRVSRAQRERNSIIGRDFIDSREQLERIASSVSDLPQIKVLGSYRVC